MPASSSANSGYVRTDSMLTVIRSMLARLALVSAVITVLAAGIGYLVADLPGIWAALIGAAISVLFNGATVLSMYLVAGRSPELLQIVLLGGWLVKMVVLVIALVWLREQSFYHRGVLVATLIVVVIAALLVEVTTVLKARIPYVEPAGSAPATDGESRLDTPAETDQSDVDHRSSHERHESPNDQVG